MPSATPEHYQVLTFGDGLRSLRDFRRPPRGVILAEIRVGDRKPPGAMADAAAARRRRIGGTIIVGAGFTALQSDVSRVGHAITDLNPEANSST